jgi:hypothetical protein
MTTDPIDLESLRSLNEALATAFSGDPANAVRAHSAASPIVNALFAELTTRRARDADVAGLVAATKKALMRFSDMNGQVSAEVWNDNWPAIKACRDALAPFTGAIHDHAGEMT